MIKNILEWILIVVAFAVLGLAGLGYYEFRCFQDKFRHPGRLIDLREWMRIPSRDEAYSPTQKKWLKFDQTRRRWRPWVEDVDGVEPPAIPTVEDRTDAKPNDIPTPRHPGHGQ